MKFKVGDKVKILKNTSASVNKVGDVGIVTEIKGLYPKVTVAGRENSGNMHYNCDLELILEVEYEDQWHLNDGKIEIPEDADKLEKDGSVVAFRKRKEKDLEFGDELKDHYGQTFKFIHYCDPDKTKANIYQPVIQTIYYGQKLTSFTRT